MNPPQDPSSVSSPSPSNAVTLASFDEALPAASLRDRLRQAGFPARLHDERRLQKFWFSSPARAGVHVEVPAEFVDAAKRRLEEWEAAHEVWPPPVHCPACKSSRVHYPNMTRKFVLPTLVAQCATWLGLMEHEYYCEACHFTWVGSGDDVEPTSGTSAKADEAP